MLVQEENEIDKPIFYLSKILKWAEVRYPKIKKVALALLLVVQKFKVYLENHQRIIVIDQPFRRILKR